MAKRKMGLSKKIFVATLGIFTVTTCIVCVVQRALYLRSFEATLRGVEQSVLDLKRRGAEDLLREIKISTQRSLQPGEYKQFIDFAAQQKELKDIEEFSFVAETGKVELSSKPERVGKAIDSALWQKVHNSKDLVVAEDASYFSMFFPLRVDADLRRLAPEWQVGQLYGSLYLRFSKEQVNRAIAGAQETFARNAARTVYIIVGMIVATLVVIGVTMVYTVIRPLARSLARIIDDLSGSSTQLVEISDQISAASQRLSEGATEQAASLEETSSQLEEMAGMTRTNATNAKEVDALANQARKAANDSDPTIKKLNSAMTGINEASDKISKIIKVIEDIAFQTNLLALNAAVEAARAGEAGKGFAVVAEEVRSLASRAAAAASETQTLINESVARAREGTGVAGEVGKALGTIATDVTKVTELINGIATASEEQAQGVEHVNAAVSQMDTVTQQNAAGAEESASAAHQLAAQANAVEAMVQELVVVVRGSNAASVRPNDGAEDRQMSTAIETVARTASPPRPHRKPARPTAVAKPKA